MSSRPSAANKNKRKKENLPNEITDVLMHRYALRNLCWFSFVCLVHHLINETSEFSLTAACGAVVL
jgi:hypothetical protein